MNQQNPFEITSRHLIYSWPAPAPRSACWRPPPRRAQTAVARLKPVVTVESDVVRLSDLIDGAGADVAVFGAPLPGGSGQISTARIVAAAREHGVTGVETSGLSTITVRRAGRRDHRRRDRAGRDGRADRGAGAQSRISRSNSTRASWRRSWKPPRHSRS